VLLSQPGIRVGPVPILFPVALLGSFVLFDLGAMIGDIEFFDRVGRWIMGTGLVVGILVLTVALVDLTSTMSGTPAHRVRGAASSGLAVMVVLFAVVWWARQDEHVGGSAGLWLVEFLAVVAGAVGAWFARDVVPGSVARSTGAQLGLGDL
jgi:uncharacterized membrane protein